MPFLTTETLKALCVARDASRGATAFAAPDGSIEPLCAIWEPAAHHPLEKRAAAGDSSLKRFLREIDTAIVGALPHGVLRNVNSPEDYEAARRAHGEN